VNAAADNRSLHGLAKNMLAVAAVLAASAPTRAQEVVDEPSLSLGIAYTGDWRRNASGGMRVGTAYADALDIGLEWVTGGLFPAARLTTNVAVMHIGGRGLSEHYVGDLQGVNGIEAASGWKLYESWVELSFGGGGHSLRAGVLDLNAEFDTPVTQGVFTASPFWIGTELSYTGERGPPVWPTTGLGLRLAGSVEEVHWRVGAYDAAPGSDRESFTNVEISREEGALLAAELEYSTERIHKAALGLWSYTSRFERVDAPLIASGRDQRGNQGFYAHLDLRAGSLGDVDLDTALRAGAAAPRFNYFDRYVGVALTASHLFASRPADALGIGVAHARLSDEYRALRDFEGQPATAAETIYELVYRAELTPWLALLPNVQHVRDPGADAFTKDSWIAGVRFELSHDHSWQLPHARRGSP
jgi:porin